MLLRLTPQERARGVITYSSGNHGQAVALAAARLGAKAVVVMPTTAPLIKVNGVKRWGAEVIMAGTTSADRRLRAEQELASRGLVMVPPFDHEWIIEGQATCGLEILEQAPDTQVVAVPVGGGGLLAGTLSWLRTRHPDVRVVGVEPAGAACMAAALAAGRPVELPAVDAFVDGAAVRRAGALTYRIVRDSAAELVVAEEGRVCAEMLDFYQLDGIIAEPAGALAAAALGSSVPVEPGSTVLCLLSGGNNDVSRYAEILERSLVFAGRKHYFLVNFRQEPGALREFLEEVLGPDDDITLFEYVKRNNRETGPALVGIELARPDDLQPLMSRMRQATPDIQLLPPDSPMTRFLI
jgi:threonine dehydratase